MIVTCGAPETNIATICNEIRTLETHAHRIRLLEND